MAKFTASRFLQFCAFAVCVMTSGVAFAAPHAPQGAEGEFTDAQVVSDKDLSTMRGGFIDINGEIMDFDFYSRTMVNGVVTNTTYISSEELAMAAANGTLNDIIPPTIIQNNLDNANINTITSLNGNIVGAAAAAGALALTNQSNISNARATF